jgi:hypothetical protein
MALITDISRLIFPAIDYAKIPILKAFKKKFKIRMINTVFFDCSADYWMFDQKFVLSICFVIGV